MISIISRIEISLQGEQVEELIEWIRKKFEVDILTSGDAGSIAIEETDFWKEMQSNRPGDPGWKNLNFFNG